jgi:hypothetical protein
MNKENDRRPQTADGRKIFDEADSEIGKVINIWRTPEGFYTGTACECKQRKLP